MKYMVSWKMQPGAHAGAAEAFLKGGAPAPAGLEILGRWHAPGSSHGWVLSEGDLNGLAEHVGEWGRFMDFEITPVLEDAEAGAALAKTYGK